VILRRLAVLALLVPMSFAAHPCESCHPKEVAGFSRSSMAHSLRRPEKVPEGSFFVPGSGTKFTIRTDSDGIWQRLERAGEVSEYRVSYVIGSGSHASGYLIRIGDHLFQSPICYYPSRRSYDLAPGYEKLADPDFTRPVSEECLLCHSGAPSHISIPVNRYEPPALAAEAISCERCHGPASEHLKRPGPGSIVNPAKLEPAARDSVCEQCHLAGIVRIPNPGKSIGDFRPGQRLEEVFTIYTASAPAAGGLKVISHSEQLGLSACARGSGGKMWCGTCHDPHTKPVETAPYYRSRCLSCHQGKLAKSHPASPGDCVGCHMPRRQARDGGHSVFTDHRVVRRPQSDEGPPAASELVAWRTGEPAYQQRNLALAYVNAGIERRSPPEIARGYRMLTDVQKAFLDDVAVLNGLGTALLLGKQPREALIAFERVLALTPANPASEQNVAMALIESGQPKKAVPHLERCLELDPLLLPAAASLMGVYRQSGDDDKARALSARIRAALSAAGAAPRKRNER
jgi:hypothetical protein